MKKFKSGDSVIFSTSRNAEKTGLVVGTSPLNNNLIIVEDSHGDLYSIAAIALTLYDSKKVEQTRTAVLVKCDEASKLIDEADKLCKSVKLTLKNDILPEDLIESIRNAGLMDECEHGWTTSSEYC